MKKLPFLLPLLVVALLLALHPTPTHAQGLAPEPTTCSRANNQFSGRIVLDVDHDNLPDANEGVEGITVTLSNVQSGTTVVGTTTTDSEGCWRFARSLMVNGQQHRISWSGMSPTAVFVHDPDNGTSFGSRYFTFTASATEPSDTDVVYRPGTVQPYLTRCPNTSGSNADIGGMVAIDRNNNNQADPGEGIAGVVVTLASVTPDQIVGQTTTDANGCYLMPRNTPDALASAPTPGNIGWGIRSLSSGPNPNTGGIGWGIRPLTADPTPTPGDNIGWGIRPTIARGSNTPNPTPGGIGWGIRPLTTKATETATTYMFVRAYLPEDMGGDLVESYDPNGRQTANFFYDVFTKPNGTFESDFLFRDLTPTAVTMSTLSAGTAATPDQTLFALAGLLVAGTVAIFRRHRV